MTVFLYLVFFAGFSMIGYFYGATMAQNPLPPLQALRDDPTLVLPPIGALLIIAATIGFARTRHTA